MGKLEVIGVRHHSPACARLVRDTIRTARPRFVLIEGPVDMNGRIGELLLEHELPIAIFSYGHGVEHRHASWSPFCSYSPEWVAITEAAKVGAETLFIDLPAWHEAFALVANRYSDRHTRASRRMELLCQRMGIEDVDALWDHLFEQALALPELRQRLQTYFRELRADDETIERDVLREAFMARWIAWALGTAGADETVLVVCGGYHAPVLEDAGRRGAPAKLERPEVPVRPDLERTGSYLVPYSFHRLDAFVGYEAGMPSPEFYQRLWEEGGDVAGERMLFTAISALRSKKQRVSPADAIAAMTLARGLRLLRGHVELSRVDVLDGLAAAVVKDALDAPLPWNRRGTLLAGTDPMLVAIVAAFSGERVGKLARGTPHPPLVADAFAEIERVGIALERSAREVTVPLTEPEGIARSRVLHRLRVLQIPGFTLGKGPVFDKGRSALREVWSVQRVLDAEAALIEAAAYGATLGAAAAAKLEEAIAGARGVGVLAAQLKEAVFVGIESLAGRLAGDVRRAAAVEPSFAELGAGLATLVALHDHDVLFGAKDAALLGEAIAAAFDRGLWLFEGLDGATGIDETRAAVALKTALARTGAKLGLDRTRALALMERRIADSEAPPPIRGAALGFLWSANPEAAAIATDAATAVKSAGRPETLGDFLGGLFALAREEVLRTRSLLQIVDQLVVPMPREDFLLAIPSLRMAFSWFPPAEREEIARALLAIHGGRPGDARTLLRLEVAAEVTMAGLAVDEAAARLAARYGLDDRSVVGEEKP